MFYLLNHFICFYLILFNSIFISNSNASKCDLPERCRIGNSDNNGYYFEVISSIFCDINNEAFEFKFKESTKNLTSCLNPNNSSINSVYFRWMSNDLAVLDKEFNFTNMIRYFDYFEASFFIVKFRNLNGFDVNFLDKVESFFDTYRTIDIHMINGQLDFYHNKTKLNSCQDFANSNITEIQSIFQMDQNTLYLNFAKYKEKICPIVFMNTSIAVFEISGFVNTFYKRNLLSFSSEEIDTSLNSIIRTLDLTDAFNIYLDLDVLHPLVFNYTQNIRIRRSLLSRINGDIFKHLINLITIEIDEISFRRINHKQGIEWIRQWNHDLNVNLSDFQENCTWHKEILVSSSTISKIFPEEDFCIYVDFPFNQLVILFAYYDLWDEFEEYSCTYLWLVQYYGYYMNICKGDILSYDVFNILLKTLNSTTFKSISKCNFEQKISSCNKSNYKIKDIWDRSDFLILNKKLQIAFKIMLYPTAFLGLVTNIIVVVVIRLKENSDLFKEFKHFSYLCLNSVFCIMILVIEILSWMNECFYPYEVFCSKIRKLVAIQFFKIIFKECLVTVFIFMSNFTYIAFALNRISLIGNEHGKLIKFFSEVGIKKYIGISLFFSASLSWIRYFKYYVNNSYNVESDEFPLLTEDKIYFSWSNKFIDAYYIINSIAFIVNYILFVVICAIIDICMVVQLRRTLAETTKKKESMMSQKQIETKKAESEEAVNKAIKMVVLNTTFGIFLKLPVSIIPILNVFAKFDLSSFAHPDFAYTYKFLKDTELYNVIEDVTYFLFNLSLSIQMFIYNRFDKKFQTGYERLMDKASFRKKTELNQTKDSSI